jgi:uroporphyrinogen decarboxylase
MEMKAPPLANALTIEELRDFLWPDNDWFDYSDLRSKLENWKDFSIMASGGSVFQHATYMRGMDTLMMDMMTDPEAANFILDKFTGFYYEYYRRMFEVAGDLIDVFALADDFGMQNTLLIGPEMFDEFVALRLKKMADLAHAYNIKLLLHTCGNIESLIPRFIELGVDILDPIQPESMDPVAIKQKYGNDICLRGGISVQNVVSRGTLDEVKAETKRILEALKPNGGYIFSPGHPVLQDDIPVENIIAMYETGYQYGFY